eukprot:TRINITY_DN17591_c0_g1_i1.p2 TRINITY_DN17591_c0_g1~~TRINITY_DN17591_c0_g1_i1.p2  ORF type:complete len:175 (-),score=16.89 TRINITY_DN17591_c0_g1_i1:19-543(-)
MPAEAGTAFDGSVWVAGGSTIALVLGSIAATAVGSTVVALGMKRAVSQAEKESTFQADKEAMQADAAAAAAPKRGRTRIKQSDQSSDASQCCLHSCSHMLVHSTGKCTLRVFEQGLACIYSRLTRILEETLAVTRQVCVALSLSMLCCQKKKKKKKKNKTKKPTQDTPPTNNTK